MRMARGRKQRTPWQVVREWGMWTGCALAFHVALIASFLAITLLLPKPKLDRQLEVTWIAPKRANPVVAPEPTPPKPPEKPQIARATPKAPAPRPPQPVPPPPQ